MKIIGLRVEKYIDKTVSGHNCDFTYTDEEFEKHVICGVLDDNRKVEIELSNSDGECGSGWTTASWGHIKVTEVKRFNGYTHVPKSPLNVDDIEPGSENDVSNGVFSVDYNGDDGYYPHGGYTIDMTLFKETDRAKSLRPVWIFVGKSATGKSYLASKLSGIDVYETDSAETLPESITASVVVLGNKHDYTVDAVKEKLFGETEVHVVDFN